MSSTSFQAPPQRERARGTAGRTAVGGGLMVSASGGNGSNGGSAAAAQQAAVSFDPPLWLQRQQWLLTTLRAHNVKSILDIGCGEGKILAALTRPPVHVDRFPTEKFAQLQAAAPPSQTAAHGAASPALGQLQLDNSARNGGAAPAEAAAASSTKSAPALLPPNYWVFRDTELSPRKLTGLDLIPEDLEEAKVLLEHVVSQSERAGPDEIRWEPLDITLLRGNLAQYNEALTGYDAIIATEVIEHLDEAILHAFAPSVLGRLRPQLCLVTTPNYAFHVHFNRDPANEGDPGFLDPTGKTARRFRHSDHKFEWTTGEFRQWCNRVASEYGYDVEVGGVGQAIYPPGVAPEERAKAKDASGEDGVEIDEDDEDSIKFASQVALFKRKPRKRASPRPDQHRAGRNGFAHPEGGSASAVGESASAGRAAEVQPTGESAGASAAASAIAAAGTSATSSAGSKDLSASTSESDSASAASSRQASVRGFSSSNNGGRRRARSRQPEHLPFLSDLTRSPEAPQSAMFPAAPLEDAQQGQAQPPRSAPAADSTTPLDSSLSTLASEGGGAEGRAGRTAAPAPVTPGSDLSGSVASLRKEGSPNSVHQLVYERHSPGYLADGRAPPGTTEGAEAAGGSGLPAAPEKSAEDIEEEVLDRLDVLAAPAHCPASDNGSGAPQKYIAARLWDVWIGGRLRRACEGRLAALVDGLRLGSAPSSAYDTLAPLGTAIVGSSPDGHWTLRVADSRGSKAARRAAGWGLAQTPGDNDLWLFYTGPQLADWTIPGEAGDAADPHAHDADASREPASDWD